MGTTTKNPHKTEIRAGVSPLAGVVRIDQIAGYTVASPVVSAATRTHEWQAGCRAAATPANRWHQIARNRIKRVLDADLGSHPGAVY